MRHANLNGQGPVRRAIFDSAMRPVVIALLDPSRASSRVRYYAVPTSTSFTLRWTRST